MVNQDFDKFIEVEKKHEAKYLGGTGDNKGITHDKHSRGKSPGSEGREVTDKNE